MSLVGNIILLAQRIAAEIKAVYSVMVAITIDDSVPTGMESLWFQPSKGKFMVKVDGQWVLTAKDGKDGKDGIDGVDGANGTMPDGSVTYAKFDTALKQRITDNDGAWDFSSAGIVDAAISSPTTVTLSNLQLNKTLKVRIVVTNSATISFPAYCKKAKGFIDPSGTDGTYYAYFDCWDSGSSTEEVLMSTTQEEV